MVHALVAGVSRLIVMDSGRIVADGDPREVLASNEVQRVYMGIEA